MTNSKANGLATRLDAHMVSLIQYFAAVRWILATDARFAVGR
jgi:hypothetical protein